MTRRKKRKNGYMKKNKITAAQALTMLALHKKKCYDLRINRELAGKLHPTPAAIQGDGKGVEVGRCHKKYN